MTQYDSKPEAGIVTRTRTGRIYISIQPLTLLNLISRSIEID
jgi:hypothetical protein